MTKEDSLPRPRAFLIVNTIPLFVNESNQYIFTQNFIFNFENNGKVILLVVSNN